MRILMWGFRVISLLIFFFLVFTYVSFRVTHVDDCRVGEFPLKLMVKTLTCASRFALRCGG